MITTITGRYSRPSNKGQAYTVYVTDKGDLTTKEAAKHLKITPNCLRGRVWRYVPTDPRVINAPKRGRVWGGNDTWKSLGD